MLDTARHFASELRRQVLRRGSIASACAATGINRQQFNKYLAAQMQPNARTLRKICAYLGVSEEQLMSGGQAAPLRPAAIPASPAIDWAPLPPGFAAVREADRPQMRLPNGFYSCYFPVHGHPGLVARWLVHIAEGPGGSQVHSCRNHFGNAAELGFAATHIRYRGPVVYGAQEVCMIGTALTPRPLRGIISAGLRPVAGADYFSAMVLTHRADGPLALAGAMHYLGPHCPARQALAGCGTIALDDQKLDPVIGRMMRTPPAAGALWLRSVSGEDLRSVNPSGKSW